MERSRKYRTQDRVSAKFIALSLTPLIPCSFQSAQAQVTVPVMTDYFDTAHFGSTRGEGIFDIDAWVVSAEQIRGANV